MNIEMLESLCTAIIILVVAIYVAKLLFDDYDDDWYNDNHTDYNGHMKLK